MLHMTQRARLTSGQIAAELGVHRTTVNYWHDTGKLVPIDEINGTRIYSRTSVERLRTERAAATEAAS